MKISIYWRVLCFSKLLQKYIKLKWPEQPTSLNSTLALLWPWWTDFIPTLMLFKQLVPTNAQWTLDNQLRIYHNYNTYEGFFIQEKVISGCSPCSQYKFAYNESNGIKSLRAYIEQDKEFAYLNSGVLFGNDHVGPSDSAYLGIHNGQIHTSSVSAVARR
jgi:hypothetical protein